MNAVRINANLRRNFMQDLFRVNNHNLDLYQNDIILSVEGEEEGEEDLAVISRVELKRPPKYKVLLHNDDYSTMEFVILILKSVFFKTQEQAEELMLLVHDTGHAVCGIYILEIAETKVAKVHTLAKKEGHPLKCSLEVDE